MIERLLETWLTRANERSFQIPFCHSLASEGYRVVHMSRHCGMEMGKDILAVAPDGVPCAFQLKGVPNGGKLTLGKWREELEKQIQPLVFGKIVHPSIDSIAVHRAYIVINGEFDEEVSRAIDDFNRATNDEGRPERKLLTIVKGDLLQRFNKLQTDFWVSHLNDVKTFLELMLANGRGRLPKEKIARLFESAMPLQDEAGAPPSKAECARATCCQCHNLFVGDLPVHARRQSCC